MGFTLTNMSIPFVCKKGHLQTKKKFSYTVLPNVWGQLDCREGCLYVRTNCYKTSTAGVKIHLFAIKSTVNTNDRFRADENPLYLTMFDRSNVSL